MSFDSVLSNIADTAESVSIPLEQGYVFRPDWHDNTLSEQIVSIPLEQGNVFRLVLAGLRDRAKESQSLWNRAMSFDSRNLLFQMNQHGLNPFGTGQCLSTKKLNIKQY